MATFMELFHPAVLNDLLKSDPSGEQLMHRLFDSAEVGRASGNTGLIYWLLNYKKRKYTKITPTDTKEVPVPIFGLAGERDQRGILCKPDNCYNYNGHGGAPIEKAEAIASAKETLDVINKICAFVDSSVANGVALDGAWYRKLNDKIVQVCSGQKYTPLWYGEDNYYQLRPYLMKYFHILYPEIFAGFYSAPHIDKALALLGIVPAANLSLTERNGLITLKMKAVIPGNSSGIRFAKALYPYFIQVT